MQRILDNMFVLSMLMAAVGLLMVPGSLLVYALTGGFDQAGTFLFAGALTALCGMAGAMGSDWIGE